MKRTIIAGFFLFCGYVLSSTAGQTDSVSPLGTNCVLIFLDDSEDYMGAITTGFFSAFVQEAGPIIVSASLIKNIRAARELLEKDPEKLTEMVQSLEKKEVRTLEEKKLIKDIIRSRIDFDVAIATKWILKKINDFLYLLLPKKYLQEKGIASEQVQIFSPQDPKITRVEQQLGLKINHLETVVQVCVVQEIAVVDHEFADYFSNALDTIFIKTREYPHQRGIPDVGIYIFGHGQFNDQICHLSVEQFRAFLSFLEKIKIKLLVYSSCYAAGSTENLIYKDSIASVTKTYNFPIVAIALTDTPTRSFVADVTVKEGTIQPVLDADYSCFVKTITQSDVIPYNDAIQCIIPRNYEINIARIRYPGLPWFSVLDYPTVASIGSSMAKSRTAPLDIAQFFAKNAKKEGLASPYVILLYDQNIPFELIVNTHDSEGCYMPRIVSMIPGNRVHYIKKISSTCNLAHDILKSFYLEGIAWHKIFVIDEITAPFSAHMSDLLTQGQATEGAITDVVIDVKEDECVQYFTYQGNVYVSQGCFEDAKEEDKDCNLKKADFEQKKKYDVFLKIAQNRRPQLSLTSARVRAVQEKKAQAIQNKATMDKKDVRMAN